jgi:peptidoglycan hydrolase-like protein with peptidoglycan-binding domain
MRISDPIRHWRHIALIAWLCLVLPSLAISQSQTTPPKKPAKASTTLAKKHSAHSTSKSASSHKSSHSSSRTSTQKSKSARARKSSKQAPRKRGQQGIDSARAREIQQALIREHYMQGEPTGVWDSSTQAAMQRFQADQGWQSKTTPDSRALIKLGLGPNHDHLLNPESAMTATTPTPKSAPPPTTAPDPGPADNPSPPETDAPKP